jgi:hypothetical protein
MNAKILRRLLLVIVAIGASIGAAVAFAASPSKPDFALALGSSTSTVTAGQSASYNITITRTGGFSGSITGTTSGSPTGVTANITPNPASSSATQFLVALQTSSSTAAGSYTIVFTGTSGSLNHTVNLPLKVTAPIASSFSLTVTDDNQNVGQGGSGAFTIAITRKNFTGAISFTFSGAPAQSITTFVPAVTPGNTTVLQVDTAANTKQGSYDLVITGTSGATTSTVPAHLTVSAGSNGKDFTISGDISQPLAPGVTAPVNLSLANTNNQAIKITSLIVSVKTTSKPACTTDNFSVRQFGGTYPLIVPANSTRTLTQLGVAAAQMPALTFIDKPINQDVCKSTNITLGYSGVGGNG